MLFKSEDAYGYLNDSSRLKNIQSVLDSAVINKDTTSHGQSGYRMSY